MNGAQRWGGGSGPLRDAPSITPLTRRGAACCRIQKEGDGLAGGGFHRRAPGDVKTHWCVGEVVGPLCGAVRSVSHY